MRCAVTLGAVAMADSLAVLAAERQHVGRVAWMSEQ
jgi:hypothetical protein